MKIKNELKETDIKNPVYYYFRDIINGTKVNFSNILLKKNYMKMSQFTTFHIKPQQAQNHCILGSIK